MKNVQGNVIYELGDKFKVLRPMGISGKSVAAGETVEVGPDLSPNDARYLEGIGKLQYAQAKKAKE